MKTFKSLVVLFVLLLSSPVVAQTTIDNTTLTAAITSTSANRVNINATTCTGCTFGQGTLLLVDDEVMQVTGAYSSGSTNIPVIRGYAGIVGTHANAAVVLLGPPIRFKASDPPIGSCTRTSQQFMPWINIGGPSVNNGPIRVWGCNNVNWFFGLNPIQITTRPLVEWRPRDAWPVAILAKLETFLRW